MPSVLQRWRLGCIESTSDRQLDYGLIAKKQKGAIRSFMSGELPASAAALRARILVGADTTRECEGSQLHGRLIVFRLTR